MSEISIYQFAVGNVKKKIQSSENARLVERGDGSAMTAFAAAEVLAVAFMKDKNEVLADLVAG